MQQRVAEYDKANPGKSERAAAAELGVSKTAIHEAREAGGHQRPPDIVTGRDGKAYPAKPPQRRMPSYIPDPPPPIRDELIERAVELVRQMTPPERVEFIRLVVGIK
jgi:hypothetical protein